MNHGSGYNKENKLEPSQNRITIVNRKKQATFSFVDIILTIESLSTHGEGPKTTAIK